MSSKTVKAPADYTPAKGCCIVLTIEAVFSLDAAREMEDTLEMLRQYGAADVVEKRWVANSFDDACRILAARASRSKA